MNICKRALFFSTRWSEAFHFFITIEDQTSRVDVRAVLNSDDHAQKSGRILHDPTSILNSAFFCVCERPKNALLASTWRNPQ